MSDKYEKTNYMSKALICIIGSALAIPAIAACVLTTNNFYLSIVMMAIKYIVSEGWLSPTFTMIVMCA